MNVHSVLATCTHGAPRPNEHSFRLRRAPTVEACRNEHLRARNECPFHQARIIDPFERAVLVRHYCGFGLELWIARMIVEAHGGTSSWRGTAPNVLARRRAGRRPPARTATPTP